MQIDRDMEIYVPPMFERMADMRSPRDRRGYVEQQLVALAESGNLVLTHILNQRPSARFMAIDVMCGTGISDGSDGQTKGKMHAGYRVPFPLKNARVKIRALNGKNVTYVDGTEPIRGVVRNVGARAEKVPAERNHVEDTGEKVADLPLREAIIALQQAGAYVAPAPNSRMRQKVWKVAEDHASLEFWKRDAGNSKK